MPNPAHYHRHTFTPNGEVLVDASFVVRPKQILFGLWTVYRTYLRLNQVHRYDGPTLHLEAYEGYEFDGATVPRPLWMFFERFGRWVRACLYHDLLYDGRIGSKVGADAAMLEIARHDGVPILEAYAMFAAVFLWPPNWWYWYAPRKKYASGWRKH